MAKRCSDCVHLGHDRETDWNGFVGSEDFDYIDCEESWRDECPWTGQIRPFPEAIRKWFKSAEACPFYEEPPQTKQ